jgi:hypothetical protein
MYRQHSKFKSHARVQGVVALLCAVMVTGCLQEDSLPSGTEHTLEEAPGVKQDSIIYGADDRRDVYAHPEARLRERAQRSTVALMKASALNTSNPSNVTFNAPTLGVDKRLCTTEPFRDDPTPAFCSGTLVDDDLVLTAGNCFTTGVTCADTRFVFKFYRTSPTTMETITTEDIFSCQSIITQASGHAMVRLDRSATPRFTPAPMNIASKPVALNQRVAMIGASAGTPLKIDSEGYVSSTSSYDFMASTDAMGKAAAGSGVYELNGFTLVGIQSKNPQLDDYKDTGTCQVARLCDQTSCSREPITYAAQAQTAYCAAAESLRFCDPTNYVKQYSWNPQRGWDLDGTIPLRLQGRPTAVIENGETAVYGRGRNGYLRRARWVPGQGWKTEQLPVPIGNPLWKPVVMPIPEWNALFVYSYTTQGCPNGCLQQASWSPGQGWVWFSVPEVPLNGTPAVAVRPQWGQTLIFSKKDECFNGFPPAWPCLQQASWTPGIGWEVFPVPEVLMSNNPTIDPEYGNLFSRENSALQQTFWSETAGWQVYSISEVPLVRDPVFGGGRLYSRRSDNRLQESYWTEAGWRTNVIPAVTLRNDPAPLRVGDRVYIFDASP